MSYTRYNLDNEIEVWFEEGQTRASRYSSNGEFKIEDYFSNDLDCGEILEIDNIFTVSRNHIVNDLSFNEFLESKLDSTKGRTREIIKDYLENKHNGDTLLSELSVYHFDVAG